MYTRAIQFHSLGSASFFLWGARQTGKSTLLKERYPHALVFDLLLRDVRRNFLERPERLRQIVLEMNPVGPVIIDEIQKVPDLLNEVHWLIENKSTQFILSGSSPRKILKAGHNLLGGRALRCDLFPLTYSEIPNFDLLRALNHGLLPSHYDATDPSKLLKAYIGNYLEDEIISETKIRKVEIFSKFLNKAAFSNGEIVNFTNIASECGVSSPTIKEYFSILEDSLIGYFVPAFQKKPKRRVVSAPKFYFFDVGIANTLLERKGITNHSFDFGAAFEHFIFQEIKAYSSYSEKEFKISYWRTSSQFEVDFVLGDHEVAIEIKSSDNITFRHCKGLLAFDDEYIVKKKIVVCQEAFPRKSDHGISIWPWQYFLKNLWSGAII